MAPQLESITHFAAGPDYKFVRKMLTFGENYQAGVGDAVETNHDYSVDGDIRGTVVEIADDRLIVRDAHGNTHDIARNVYLFIRESPTVAAVWDECMRGDRPDGVAFSDELVPAALQASLAANFEALLAAEAADYHPGSGTRVRDLVHPSLYPYVRGKSIVRTGAAPAAAKSTYDRWGRHYEDSNFQWLPSQFHVADDGNVTIASYINNLADGYAPLQADLAQLFQCALPLLESVMGYVAATKFWVEDDPDLGCEADLPDNIEPGPVKIDPMPLRGRELQVIPKLVEYKLEPGETHEGVWHVEGMSHEHIVATCVYVLDRDESVQGGDLSFKRAFTPEEAGICFWGMDQSRPQPAEIMVEAAEVPLGSIATPKGRLFVFPNSHIHKLNTLQVQGSSAGRRRVIVFWLVDPEVPIISTRDVARQQSLWSSEEALAIRLQLMEERKRHKASFNIRAVSLCEH